MAIRRAGPKFWERLAKEVEGGAACDPFTRGRYATDASMYQCFPAGVAYPKSDRDVAIIIEMAREEGIPVTARGGGTSTAGQALGEGIVVDFSKHLSRIINIDAANQRCVVEPGCSPAALNAVLRPLELMFPAGIASAQQATIGGMIGNNSSGIRALRYGSMRDKIASADAFLADGQRVEFKEISESDGGASSARRERLLDLLQFGELHEKAIATLWPLRAPGMPEPEGYDLRCLLASSQNQNPARLLAGSEGTLALTVKIELKLAKLSANRALGICRLADLATALTLVPKILLLNPSAIELLDRSLLEFLASRAKRDAQAVRLLQGEPEVVLIVEFDDENPVENTRLLKTLDEYVSEGGKGKFGVIEIIGEKARARLWRLRKEALTRAWALKTSAQPVSFLEDAAVPVASLQDYGAELDALFAEHGVRPAIYGNVGQGCLQVRPILDLRHAQDRKRMRNLADEMAGLLRKHGGMLTGGHGIGIARTEALERRLGPEAISLFAQLKSYLDPAYLLNPGKILRGPRFDDPELLRASQDGDNAADVTAALNWGSSGAGAGAARCNGLSLCRTAEPRFACPSFGVTHDERDSPRGRANTVRLAQSGQLGEGAFASGLMLETMSLCVSCKVCKSACPFGIDIPRMKVEALAAARDRGWKSKAEELYARLPEYSSRAKGWRAVLALRDVVPALANLSERRLGLAADRPWPKWSGRRFRAPLNPRPRKRGTVAIFADTFNRSFEPANLRAAAAVLKAAGYAVASFRDEGEERPLCCGRTYYDTGHVEEARREAKRMSRACAAYESKGVPIIGLEPACALMMRDEYKALGLPMKPKPQILLFEEFLAARLAEKQFAIALKAVEADLVLHAHCHERALGIEAASERVLKLVPALSVSSAPPGCCGLNGVTGMTPDTFDASLAMAELTLFPAIRKAGRDAFISATGFSCRKQIHDGLGRTARHPAMILELALKGDAEIVG
ncbi:MAG: FAD-binding and (Fe-S)-binding domain-containing protein [Rhodomicrobium sp.]